MPEDEPFDELTYLRGEVTRLRKSLNDLTPGLDLILRRRGFQIYKKEPTDDLLIPRKEFEDEYYRMLHKYSFRLFLRDVIKHQKHFTLERVTRYATSDITRGYLEFLRHLGLAKIEGSGYVLERRIQSFGETLEWFVAEIFRREFGSETSWGVKFKRPKVGGDYDVIARFDGALFYIEVKSSPPKQIYESEIAAFLDRVSDLSPDVSVFFMDTELRMKDKIVPMFENEFMRRSAEPPELRRIEKELFQAENRIFIINAKDSIVRNIEKVLNIYFRG
ncbi:MAG: hypothetical protein HZA17_13910 [Nitrospirae bacterium]|nr:hypothetical protein [Nitrospirota bacterium]